MNKTIISLLLIVSITIFSTGCWSYREIDKLALVSGIAVDKNNLDNNYELTAEIIDITASTREPKFNSTRISSKGNGFFDCLRNMINLSAKQLFLSHASVLIISEDAARDGILPLLDWILRDSEPRITLYPLVSEAEYAKEILSAHSLSTEIRSFEIEDMIISNDKLSKIPNIKVYEIINDISSSGIYAVLPTVKSVINEGTRTMALSGGAIFNKDKLAGYMGLEDVKYYLFVRNKISGGLITIGFPSDIPIDNITLEILRNKTKVTPMFSNNELYMDIKIKTKVFIAESDTNIDIINKSIIEQLEFTAEESIKNNIISLINMIQADYGLDIFGFGDIVKEKMPKLWKEINNNWDEIFKELKVEVDVDVNIRGSGHSSKTFGNTN